MVWQYTCVVATKRSNDIERLTKKNIERLTIARVLNSGCFLFKHFEIIGYPKGQSP